jgi:hypothetical protein
MISFRVFVSIVHVLHNAGACPCAFVNVLLALGFACSLFHFVFRLVTSFRVQTAVKAFKQLK